MPKFMYRVRYVAPQGAQGLLKEGGTSRRETVKAMVEAAGGKLEAFYFAFGEDDVIVISDLPDAQVATAIALTVNAGGSAVVTTVPLITPEEVDDAVTRKVDYRVPGT